MQLIILLKTISMKKLFLFSATVSLTIACNTNSEKKETKADPDKGYTVISVVQEEIAEKKSGSDSMVYIPSANSPIKTYEEVRKICYVNYKVKISKKEMLITNEADAVLEKYTIAAAKELDYGGAGGALKSYIEYDIFNESQQKFKVIQMTGIDSTASYIEFRGDDKVRTLSLTKSPASMCKYPF